MYKYYILDTFEHGALQKFARVEVIAAMEMTGRTPEEALYD